MAFSRARHGAAAGCSQGEDDGITSGAGEIAGEIAVQSGAERCRAVQSGAAAAWQRPAPSTLRPPSHVVEPWNRRLARPIGHPTRLVPPNHAPRRTDCVNWLSNLHERAATAARCVEPSSALLHRRRPLLCGGRCYQPAASAPELPQKRPLPREPPYSDGHGPGSSQKSAQLI